MVKRKHTLLITDRNPHVREFLKRELTAAGYRVCIAENGRQTLKWVYSNEPIDLMILDPDLPDAEDSSLLIQLRNRIPVLPVVYHTFSPDCAGASAVLEPEAFVEKGGSSIEGLKQAVLDILKNRRPATSEAARSR